jgi:hypothetical protein
MAAMQGPPSSMLSRIFTTFDMGVIRIAEGQSGKPHYAFNMNFLLSQQVLGIGVSLHSKKFVTLSPRCVHASA